MNQDEARRAIAEYLTLEGEASPETLQQACDTVATDGAYSRFLAEELGFHGEWISECRRFREQVAEFCGATPERRRAEMPEALAHLEVCGSCRALRWQVQPPWEPFVAGSRRLAESLKVTVAPLGELLEMGGGPPPVHQPVVAEVMGEEGERLRTARREWLLEEEEEGIAFHVVMRGNPDGTSEVDCRIRPEEPSAEAVLEQARLEVLSEPRGESYLAGRLDLVRPFILPPGRWAIHIRIPQRGNSRYWIIPVEVAKWGDDAP